MFDHLNIATNETEMNKKKKIRGKQERKTHSPWPNLASECGVTKKKLLKYIKEKKNC